MFSDLVHGQLARGIKPVAFRVRLDTSLNSSCTTAATVVPLLTTICRQMIVLLVVAGSAMAPLFSFGMQAVAPGSVA